MATTSAPAKPAAPKPASPPPKPAAPAKPPTTSSGATSSPSTRTGSTGSSTGTGTNNSKTGPKSDSASLSKEAREESKDESSSRVDSIIKGIRDEPDTDEKGPEGASDAKAGEEKNGEAKETKAGDEKPGETQETKPGEEKAGDTQETKPGEEKPGDAPETKSTPQDVLTNADASPQEKGAAVREILESDRSDFSPEEREQLVNAAMDSRDPAIRELAQERLFGEGPDVVNPASEQIGRRVQQRVYDEAREAFQDGDTDSPLHTTGELFEIQRLNGPKPEDAPKHADHFEGEIDTEKLNARLTQELGSESVQAEISKLSQEELAAWRNSDEGKELIQQQADYLASDELQQRLRLASPEERDSIMNQELQELAILDPERAGAASETMVNRRAATALDRPLEGFQDMPPEQQEAALQGVVGQVLGHSKTSTKAGRDLLKELRDLPASTSLQNIAKTLRGRLAGKSPALERALSEEGMQARTGTYDRAAGRLSKGLLALGVMGLGNDFMQGNHPFKDFDTALSQAGQISGIAAGSARPVAGLLGRGREASLVDDLFKGGQTLFSSEGKFTGLGLSAATRELAAGSKTLTNIARLGRVASVAPVVGDVLGTVMDSKAAWDHHAAGNHAKGNTYAAAAGLGALATGAGVVALQAGAVNAWNPAGWVALGAGATAVGVGYAASQMDGAGEKLVKKHGMFDAPAAAYYAMDGATTNDGQLIRALQGRSASEMRDIRAEYQRRYGRELTNDIRWDTSGHYEDTLVAMAQGYEEGNFNGNTGARIVHDAIKGVGTNEADLIRTLTRRSPEELKELRQAFQRNYGASVESWVRADTSGQFERALISLLGTSY